MSAAEKALGRSLDDGDNQSGGTQANPHESLRERSSNHAHLDAASPRSSPLTTSAAAATGGGDTNREPQHRLDRSTTRLSGHSDAELDEDQDAHSNHENWHDTAKLPATQASMQPSQASSSQPSPHVAPSSLSHSAPRTPSGGSRRPPVPRSRYPVYPSPQPPLPSHATTSQLPPHPPPPPAPNPRTAHNNSEQHSGRMAGPPSPTHAWAAAPPTPPTSIARKIRNAVGARFGLSSTPGCTVGGAAKSGLSPNMIREGRGVSAGPSHANSGSAEFEHGGHGRRTPAWRLDTENSVAGGCRVQGAQAHMPHSI